LLQHRYPHPEQTFPLFSFQPHFRNLIQRTRNISDTRHFHQGLVNCETNKPHVHDDSMANLSDKLSDMTTPHTDRRTIILGDGCSLCVVLHNTK